MTDSQPAGSDGDVGLLSPVSASPLVAALTGDRAVLAAILAVEAGWAAVLEKPASLRPAPRPSWPTRPTRPATTLPASPCGRRAAATRSSRCWRTSARRSRPWTPGVPVHRCWCTACGAHLADQPGRAGYRTHAAGAEHRFGAARGRERHDGGARPPRGAACGDAVRRQEPDAAFAAVHVRAQGSAVVPRAGRRCAPARGPGAARPDRRRGGHPGRGHRADGRIGLGSLRPVR